MWSGPVCTYIIEENKFASVRLFFLTHNRTNYETYILDDDA